MKMSFKQIATIRALFAFCVPVAHAGFISLTHTSGNIWNIQFSPITLTLKNNPGSTDLDWLIFEDFFSANSTGTGAKIGTETFTSGSVRT
jgi:hypothetical protein